MGEKKQPAQGQKEGPIWGKVAGQGRELETGPYLSSQKIVTKSHTERPTSIFGKFSGSFTT